MDLKKTDTSVPVLGGKLLALLFLFALLIRLAAIAATGFAKAEFGDARAYLGAAQALATTGHYPVRTDAYFFRAPGYPLFLLLCTLGNPQRIALAKLANAIVGSFAVLLLAVLSAWIFRERKLAMATGIVGALHPSFVLIGADIQSEPLFLVFLLGAGWFLLAGTDRPSTNLALLAGLSLALAALTRPSALALTPALAAPLLDRRYPPRIRTHLAAAAVVGFLFGIAPWTLRNVLRFHEVIPISDSFGSTFYDGNSSWMERFYRIRTRPEYDAWLMAMDRDKRRLLARIDPDGRLSPQARSRAFVRLALEDRARDSSGTLLLYAHKTWHWLRPYPTTWFRPLEIVAAVGIYYLALYAAAAIGLAHARRRGVAVLCLFVLVVAALAHIVILPLWRYRIAYWDPVLILYGVFGFDQLLRHGRRSGALPDESSIRSWPSSRSEPGQKPGTNQATLRSASAII